MRGVTRILAVLVLAACDEPVYVDAGSDSGVDDAGMVDSDAGSDAGPPLCGGELCEAGEGCVGGLCVETCGSDAAALDAALGAGLTPVVNYCRPGASAFAVQAGDPDVFDVTSGMAGAQVTFGLFGWLPDELQPSPVTTQIALPTFTPPADTYAFAGGFLEVKTTHALFGYTTSATGAPGEIFTVALADGAIERIDAPGNFDAAWLDATRFVVNGFGVDTVGGEQGLYIGDGVAPPGAAQIASGPGDYSGSVVVTDDYVIAGGSVDVTFENVVYVIERAAFDAAVIADEVIAIGTDARAVEVRAPDGTALSASTFTMVDGRFVVLPYAGEITAYTTAFDGTDLTLSEPEVLAMGPAFKDVLSAGGGRLYLVHANGVLLVE